MVAYYILFPDMKWLTFAIPIPGYSTNKDIEKIHKNGFILPRNLKLQIIK